MKKTYIEPTVEVVEAEVPTILGESDNYIGQGSNADASAKRSQFLIEDEE